MNEFRLTIHGDPVAKGRGRIVRFGNRAGIKTPEKTRRYEDIVRQTAIREWGDRAPIGVACVLDAQFYRAVPVSWSGKKTRAALEGALFPTAKPDLDNNIKAVTDGLNGVVYLDDALIVEANCVKRFAASPRVEIVIRWTDPSPV